MRFLVDERNDGKFKLLGFYSLYLKLDEVQREPLANKMLKAAEPILIKALDKEMKPHPKVGRGTLRDSLKSTGVRQNGFNDFYLAYRATTGNETAKDRAKGITNQDKMMYLINREFIRARNEKGYAIPAYDVIGKAVDACEYRIKDAMQEAFNEEMRRLGL